jgi:hypothetical protein
MFVGSVAVTVLSLPRLVFAASEVGLSLTGPASVSLGERFGVVVEMGPSTKGVDTARVLLHFDTDKLVAEDITLLGNLNRRSPGTGVDAKKGEVSIGAYTYAHGPTETAVSFALVTFTSLAVGETRITIDPESKLISDGEEQANTSKFGLYTLTISPPSTVPSHDFQLQCSTHPSEDLWYASKTVHCSWIPPVDKPLVFAVAQSPNTRPGEQMASGTSEWTGEVGDGVWYFQVAQQEPNGVETPVAQYRIRIDTTPPNPFEPHLDRYRWLEGETVLVTFGALDELSDVLRYEVSLNNGPYREKTSPFAIADLPVGDLLVEVRATDRAGNVRYGKTGLRVYPEGTDLIELDTAEEKALAEAKDSGWGLVVGSSLIIVIAGILYAISRRRK